MFNIDFGVNAERWLDTTSIVAPRGFVVAGARSRMLSANFDPNQVVGQGVDATGEARAMGGYPLAGRRGHLVRSVGGIGGLVIGVANTWCSISLTEPKALK